MTTRLRSNETAATDLYILGDLFEVWIGDDAGGALGDAVAAQLARLARAGTRVRLMHGNRDFLLGTEFAARAGATLLDDPYVTRLYGERVLLSHGDQLCTDDHDYLAFRREVRNHTWQARFLASSVPYREAFARNARDASREIIMSSLFLSQLCMEGLLIGLHGCYLLGQFAALPLMSQEQTTGSI